MIVAAERAALLGAAYRGRYSSGCSEFELLDHGYGGQHHDITFRGIKQQRNDSGKWSTERRFTFWKRYGWFAKGYPLKYCLAWDEHTGGGDGERRADIHHPLLAWLPWMPKDGARQGPWKCKGVIDLEPTEALALLMDLRSKVEAPSKNVLFQPSQAEFSIEIKGTINIANRHSTTQTYELDELEVKDGLSMIHKHLSTV